MDYFYFGCDWVIAKGTGFIKVAQLAVQLQARLGILGPTKENPEGFLIITLVIRLVKMSDLETFKQMISPELGVTDWYPIRSDVYEKAKDILIAHSQSLSSEQTANLDNTISGVKTNESLKERLTNMTKQNLFFACDWIIFPKQLLLLRKAQNAINGLDGGIHFLNIDDNQQGYVVVTVGLRISSISKLDYFINEVGQEMGLIEWHSIEEEDYYRGMKLTDHDNLVSGVQEIIKGYQKFATRNDLLFKEKNNSD